MDLPEGLETWAADAISALGGTPPLSWQALAAEASYRHFYRVRGRATERGREQPRGSWVVMWSPPQLENNSQFVALARLFRRHGIGVPELHAVDLNRGYALLADLGSRHFADLYAEQGPGSLLEATLDTLLRLQAIDDAAIPPYTAQRFRDELTIFTEWFAARWLGTPAPEASLEPCFETLVACTQEQPQCCVHRDFHCRNLLLDDAGRVGVVDFQDALRGPAAYDLASLLRDCYYRFPEAEVARWREAYLTRSPLPLDRACFARQLDLTAIQRQLKAVGIFARLQLRDGKTSHLRHILPVLEQTGELSGRYRELEPLAGYLQRVLPAAAARLRTG